MANLGASFLINLMTLTAEVGGIALALQLASSVDYLLWVPVAAIAVWLVIWRVKFSIMENVTGLVGLTLIGFAVALFLLGPDWGELAPAGAAAGLRSVRAGVDLLVLRDRPVRRGDDAVRGVLLLLRRGRGGLDGEGPGASPGPTCWSGSRSAACCRWRSPAAPRSSCCRSCIAVTSLSQVMLPVAVAGGKLLLAVVIVGIVAATFGAALETTLSTGYTLAQFFGWSWGKFRPPAQAARFHLTMIICLIVGVGVLLTGVDPIQVTEILGGVLGGRAAADLPADPDRRQRPGVHGRARQLAGD